MKKFKLALLASSMFTTFIINAQTVTNAWNGAPSNCDTGCAQSNLVGVSGNNSGSQEGAKVIYQGSFTGNTSFTVTRHALVSVNLTASGQKTASVSVSGSDGDGCSNASSHNATTAQVNVYGTLFAGGTCFVNPGTYNVSARRTDGNTATAILMVVEFP